ncbi:hypothetical protein [Kitasatospora aureofaciens]|uniref:hypothetical protein n=1 Tax=Kitasatospora aureofaciens TaxID=1894 RepID=UPI0005279BE6|nr:hypothetical protein [Kitasatospora aureofaciens]
MTPEHYQLLYRHAELYAVHLVRCAAQGHPLVPAADEAMTLLAGQHTPLTAHDGALATIGALARLSYTALRAAAPSTGRPAHQWPPAAPVAPSPDQVHAITDALERRDRDLLAASASAHGHTCAELARLAMAEQLPGGIPLHESAQGPLTRALARDNTPETALLSLLAAAADLALACLRELVHTTAAQDSAAILDRLLDDFELHKVTRAAGTAPA